MCSNIAPSVEEDDHHIADLIKKKRLPRVYTSTTPCLALCSWTDTAVVREGRATDAARFSELNAKLMKSVRTESSLHNSHNHSHLSLAEGG